MSLCRPRTEVGVRAASLAWPLQARSKSSRAFFLTSLWLGMCALKRRLVNRRRQGAFYAPVPTGHRSALVGHGFWWLENSRCHPYAGGQGCLQSVPPSLARSLSPSLSSPPHSLSLSLCLCLSVSLPLFLALPLFLLSHCFLGAVTSLFTIFWLVQAMKGEITLDHFITHRFEGMQGTHSMHRLSLSSWHSSCRIRQVRSKRSRLCTAATV